MLVDDLEVSIERCHPRIEAGGSIVFSFDDLLVAVIELAADVDALAVAPVVTCALLNEHNVVVHILVFLLHGELPFDRNGTKQRMRLREAFVRGEMSPRQVVFNRRVD
jgi:hypothetical protein